MQTQCIHYYILVMYAEKILYPILKDYDIVYFTLYKVHRKKHTAPKTKYW